MSEHSSSELQTDKDKSSIREEDEEQSDSVSVLSRISASKSEKEKMQTIKDVDQLEFSKIAANKPSANTYFQGSGNNRYQSSRYSFVS